MFTFPFPIYQTEVNLAAVFGPPDFTSANLGNPVVNGTLYQAAHGLGVVPELVVAELVCINADSGYSPGDVISWRCVQRDSTGGIHESGHIYGADATNCFLTVAANRYSSSLKTGGGSGFTLTNWAIRFQAWETVPNFTSTPINAPLNGGVKYSAAHGLGSGVYYPMYKLTCNVAEFNYSIGDVIHVHGGGIINSGNGSSVQRNAQIGYNSTDVWIGLTSMNLFDKNTGQNATSFYTNWDAELVMIELPTADFTATPQAWANAGANTAAHGLTTVDFMMAEMVCTTTQNAWVAGDRMPYNQVLWDTAGGGSGQNRGSTIGYDGTNLFSSHAAFAYMLTNRDTPVATDGTVMLTGNWQIEFSAWGS